MFRFHCGYSKPCISLDDKDEFIHSIWLHFVHFNPHAELEQLRKGLHQTLQVELLALTYSNELWAVLAASPIFEVTPKLLLDSLVVHYSENGSNSRTKEEALIYMWSEYVTESSSRVDVTTQEIIKFMSGSSKLPATGFENTPTVFFTDEDRLPTASTCDISITFPRTMALLEYDVFCSKMDMCILGSYGFGSV